MYVYSGGGANGQDPNFSARAQATNSNNDKQY